VSWPAHLNPFGRARPPEHEGAFAKPLGSAIRGERSKALVLRRANRAPLESHSNSCKHSRAKRPIGEPFVGRPLSTSVSLIHLLALPILADFRVWAGSLVGRAGRGKSVRCVVSVAGASVAATMAAPPPSVNFIIRGEARRLESSRIITCLLGAKSAARRTRMGELGERRSSLRSSELHLRRPPPRWLP